MAVKPAASAPKPVNGNLESHRGIPIPQGPVPKLPLTALVGTPFGTSPPQRDASPLSARVASSPTTPVAPELTATKLMHRFASQTTLSDSTRRHSPGSSPASKPAGRMSLSGESTPPKRPSPKENPSPPGVRSQGSSPPGIQRLITSSSVLSNEVPSEAAIVRKKLQNLSKLSTDNVNIKQLEIDLYICLHNYPSEHDLIMNVLMGVRTIAIQNDRRDRIEELLFRMMLRKENIPFLNAFFKQISEDLGALVVKVMPYLLKKMEIWELTLLLSHFTREDLKSQTLDTLFRENCISSFLCRELGNHLWAKDLKTLSEILQRDLKRCDDLSLLCLDRGQIAKKLTENQTLLFGNNSEETIEETLKENAVRFSQWAAKILPSIFLLNIPDQFAALLKTRRLDITRFLNSLLPSTENPLKASRIYVGELLCQRILCPQILNIVDKEKHPDTYGALFNLTKVIKCLSHESEFHENQGIYVSLNPLLQEFRDKFRIYIDSITLDR